jgi:hypothetical protein
MVLDAEAVTDPAFLALAVLTFFERECILFLTEKRLFSIVGKLLLEAQNFFASPVIRDGAKRICCIYVNDETYSKWQLIALQSQRAENTVCIVHAQGKNFAEFIRYTPTQYDADLL